MHFALCLFKSIVFNEQTSLVWSRKNSAPKQSTYLVVTAKYSSHKIWNVIVTCICKMPHVERMLQHENQAQLSRWSEFQGFSSKSN